MIIFQGLELVQILGLSAFAILMVAAAVQDLLTMRISNKISILLAGAFALIAIANQMAPLDVALRLATSVALCAILLLPFSMGWMGGGDVKLMVAGALWFQPPEQLVIYLVFTSICGGLLTMTLLGFRTIPVPAFAVTWGWVDRLHNNRQTVPYGIGIAFGGLIAQYLILTSFMR